MGLILLAFRVKNTPIRGPAAAMSAGAALKKTGRPRKNAEAGAAAAGVGHFIFASSCSMYGYAEGGPRKEGDPTNPLTAYARSKIGTEEGARAQVRELA